MQYKDKKSRDRPIIILLSVGSLIVTYIAICIAPYAKAGIPGLVRNSQNISFIPTSIRWVEYTPKTIMICLVIYAIAAALLMSSRRRYHRSGVENGSADYANIRELRSEFNSSSQHRIVFTKHFAMSTTKEDTFKHNRNYNTVILGGPGAGKTAGYVYPNLLQKNGSYVVLDPAGEVCRNTGKILENSGYKVKVLNLVNPNYSWGYNPFHYIRTDTENEQHADDDIQKIVTAIFKATTPPNSQTQDPFWDEAGKMLLSALMYLVYYFGAESEKNFPFIMELLRAGRNSGDDISPLDILFNELEQKYPTHIAVHFYRNAVSGAENTMRSIYITLISRLQKFEIPSVAKMMSEDELELDKIGEEKTVLYCIIPDNDSSYNFIIGMLYIQLFQALYDKADNVHQGRLPLMVHVLMDEFANVSVPDDFLYILATCRKRNIGISIILQSLAQLKEKYKEAYENIIGQCSFVLYLGGNEPSSHEFISKLMGKETIDTSTYGRRYGAHGDASSNYQFAGRELLTPDEVRVLSYRYAILIISNARPLIDLKINIFKSKIAKGTAIRGNKAMAYNIPLRSQRKPTALVSSLEKEKNIVIETSIGEYKDFDFEMLVNAELTADDIYGDVINQYSIDFEELEKLIIKE